MTDNQLDIVAHTLGIEYYNAKHSQSLGDKILPTEFYRNYYCACREDGTPDPILVELEELGFMVRWIKFSNLMFRVTDEGIKAFRKQFTEEVTNTWVEPPKSKRNYIEYLNGGCESFSDYLGIVVPKIESEWDYKTRGYVWRYCSRKYVGVNGDWKSKKVDAKASYKLALKEYKGKLKVVVE